ncbi:hypothetical protein FOMPIDRAFT_90060 [Fomitopsis schrenkii]|uniref:USP domain-containing protein n=1 Tax=Fomitopsis schrenkii TaxID=2126942 RepID=S8E046_FOMSC|nr:hypothetical protein FOMPIDRAFT_90060 [Fomitopsis schrenkii]
MYHSLESIWTPIPAVGDFPDALECGECRRVRYRIDAADVASVPVPARETGKDVEGRTTYEEVALEQCLEILTALEVLAYSCPACRKNVIATQRARFAMFPQLLVVHAEKFQLVNWVPAKLGGLSRTLVL